MLYDIWLRLARGDRAGAQQVVGSIPQDANEPVLLSFLAFDLGITKLLSPRQLQVLLRLQPTEFGGNRGGWGMTLAFGNYVLGDSARMRAYADSALPSLLHAVQENPDEPNNHIALGTAYAFLGRKADAIRAGERAVAIRGDDGFQGPGLHHGLSRIYMFVGEPAKAVEQIEGLLRVPYLMSPGWLRADPSLDPLRSHPRFQRLLAVADTVGR
jgi:hypothetical protein